MVAIVFFALGASAQRRASAAPHTRCDPVASTSFSFGLTGGNLRPTGWRIAASGAVSPVGDSTGSSRRRSSVSTRALRDIARRAWTGGFTRLPTAPTRPTRNPDVARQYIELHSACGAKHVEYASGEGAPAFRELYTRLEALTQPR
jgi:hypothetical protein